MKHITSIILLLFILSCSTITIPDEPVTLLPVIPKQIDTADYSSLVAAFGLAGIYEAPDYYGGLTPKYEMALAYSDTEDEECLNRSGGKRGLCENVVVKIDGNYQHLQTKSDFRECFAPIETEQEALSYVAIWSGTTPEYEFKMIDRYRTFVKVVHKSFSQKTDSGFITLTYAYDLFGCGPHSHYSVESFVDCNGKAKERESSKIYEPSKEEHVYLIRAVTNLPNPCHKEPCYEFYYPRYRSCTTPLFLPILPQAVA